MSVGASLLLVSMAGCSRGPTLVWSDEFAGPQGSPADSAVWAPMTGGKGWGNHELECYTDSRDNSALDGNGYLVISARAAKGHACVDGSTNDYTSARLSTQGRKTFEYGTLAVRAKMPTGDGAWPAFWALGEDHETAGWPASGEIDVTEVVGKQKNVTHGTLHGPTVDGKPFSVSGTQTLPADLSSDFHVYSATWTPTSVEFAVDDAVYARFTKDDVEKHGRWVYDKPFYLLLNVAVGGDFPGNPSANSFWPQQMVVDWVRVYQDG
jgi:beta-glucanase (GH16 family)